MKKNFITKCLVLVSAVLLCTNLTGCCIPIPNISNINPTYINEEPDPVIDDDHDNNLPGTDLSLPESGISHSGDNNTVSKIEWAKETSNGNDVEIIYTNGVSDDFELGNGWTFGDLADFLAYAIDRFDKENFRYLFSLIYKDSENYYAKVKQFKDANYSIDMMNCEIASVSWEVSNHYGNIEKIVIKDGYDSYYIIATDQSLLSEGHFVWELDHFEFYLVRSDMDLSNKISYSCSANTDETLNLYATAMSILYEQKGGDENYSNIDSYIQSSGSPSSNSGNIGNSGNEGTDNTSPNLGGFSDPSDFQTTWASGYETEMIKAVEKHYNSKVVKIVQDEGYSEYSEVYNFELEDGSTCCYYGSSSIAYIYDTSKSFDTFWERD